MLFYNKKLVATPPKTFSELVATTKELAQNSGIGPFAYYQYDPFWVFPLAHGFGATEYAPDGKTPALDSEGWVKTYQLLHDLKFKDKAVPERCDYDCADQGFKAGTIAMIVNVDWALYGDSGYIKALSDDLDVTPWPSVGSDPATNIPTPLISGMYLLFPQASTGDKLQTSSAFAKFLATDEATTLRWTLPNDHLPALLSALKNEKVSRDPILGVSSAVM